MPLGGWPISMSKRVTSSSGWRRLRLPFHPSRSELLKIQTILSALHFLNPCWLRWLRCLLGLLEAKPKDFKEQEKELKEAKEAKENKEKEMQLQAW